jgi:transcriptional regulator of acetoin/glycerol metabolism
MLGSNQHADKVYQLTQEKSAGASSPIAASWRRCMTRYGLTPEEKREPLRLTDAEFQEVLGQSGHVVEEASSELDWLFGMVGRAGCCIVITDSSGVVLDRRGVSGEDKEFRDLGLWTGALWSEASVGTNGIGTALADGRMVTVFRDQHFLSSNIGLSCASAPVRDHVGRIVAAIDISTARRDASEMIMPVLAQAARDAACRIEVNLFRRAYSRARIVLLDNQSHGAGRNARRASGAQDRRRDDPERHSGLGHPQRVPRGQRRGSAGGRTCGPSARACAQQRQCIADGADAWDQPSDPAQKDQQAEFA